MQYNNQHFTINYDLSNLTQLESLVILHGWGSNKEIMKQAFANCLGDFKHIYIDMPGFGKSANEVVLTTQDYANIIREFLKDERPIAAVGHSFGGKVATLLGFDNLVLLSSSGIIEPKPLKVKIKIALFKFLKSFGGGHLRKLFASDDAKNMNAGMYETFKNVVNEDFSESFAKFKHNAIVIWGENDKATHVSSGRKIADLIPNSQFFVLDGDHYFFLRHAKEVCRIINANLKRGL